MALSKRTDFGDAKYAGVEVDDRASFDVPGALSAVLDAGFDFVVAPLALQPAQRRSRFRRLRGVASVPGAVSADFGNGDGAPPPPWAPSDLLLPSSAWSSQVVGKLSTWIDCDAEDADAAADESASEEHSGGRGDAGRDADAVTAATAAASPRAVRRELALDSEAALAQELAWAAHLSLQAVILQPPPPPPPPVASSRRTRRHRPGLGPNGARAVCSGLRGLGAPAVWLRLPLWWREEGRATGAEGEVGRNEKENGEACADDADQEDPWHSWDELRHLCEHSSRLGVMLDLPSKIVPGGSSSSSSGGGGGGEGGGTKDHPAVAALRRWVGEPLKAVCLPSAAFVANRRGFPALPRVHQELLQVAFAAGVQVVMGGAPEIVPPLSPPPANGENAGGGGGMGTNDPLSADAAAARAAREYLAHVFRRPGPPALPGGNADHMSDEDARRLREDLAGYRDFLQAPLQPLQDNLESSTYETFERDSPKYSAYGEAVSCYLSDRLAARKAAEAGVAERGEGDVTVIMVVGAGRGPLVRASLAAADSVGARVRVYAVEKNPNAVITLQGLLATEPAWRGRVCVVARDMRRWRAPEAADLLVSELLGSFGDNEMSPECLDGAQRFLKKGTGVSIPASYTSFLEPVTAAKPWSDARGSGGGGGGGGGSAGDGGGGGGNGGCGENSAAAVQALETPYVVHLHRFTSCSRGSTRPVFTFDHPRKGAGAWKGVGGKEDRGGKGGGLEEDESDGDDDDDDDPNARRITLRFDRQNEPSALVHGLAGYFETTLYSSRRTGKTVKLSTHPPTHTPGMASWFPIFFPLVSPLRAPAGREVEVSMWRRRKGARVWYEWSAKCGGSATHVHNPGGRSYYVGL